MRAHAVGDVPGTRAVVRTCLDDPYEGDAEELGAAFHPISHSFSEREGVVVDLPGERRFEVARNRPLPATSGLAREARILHARYERAGSGLRKGGLPDTAAVLRPPYLGPNRTETGLGDGEQGLPRGHP